MFEKALKGNNHYWMWLAFLGFFIAIAAVCYLQTVFLRFRPHRHEP